MYNIAHWTQCNVLCGKVRLTITYPKKSVKRRNKIKWHWVTAQPFGAIVFQNTKPITEQQQQEEQTTCPECIIKTHSLT